MIKTLINSLLNKHTCFSLCLLASSAANNFASISKMTALRPPSPESGDLYLARILSVVTFSVITSPFKNKFTKYRYKEFTENKPQITCNENDESQIRL